MDERENRHASLSKPEQAPENSGFVVLRRVIPQPLIDDVLRILHIDLLERGADAATLSNWLWSASWFPHLRHREEILALAGALPREWRTGTICDPQILLQFPHVGPEPEVTFHCDEEPHWAEGRRYLRIVGIPLSQWRLNNGCLLIRSAAQPIPVELDPGDAVMVQPQTAHSGGINRTGGVRYGVYLRWISE